MIVKLPPPRGSVSPIKPISFVKPLSSSQIAEKARKSAPKMMCLCPASEAPTHILTAMRGFHDQIQEQKAEVRLTNGSSGLFRGARFCPTPLRNGTREGRTSPGRGGQHRACAVGGAGSSLRTRRSAGRTHAAQLAKLQTAGQTAQCAASARRRERERKLRRGSVGFSTSDKDAFPDRRPEPCSFAIRRGLQRASSSIWSPLSRKSLAIPFQTGSFRGEFSSVDSDLLRLTSLGNPASRGTSVPGHTCFTPAPAPPRQQAHSQVVRLRMDHELSKRKKVEILNYAAI
ncbi:uncharacterized protein [Macaca nemestrina]|uniref:uncharacterized protein n=1 Tax=Macaca nemestrina TaxID=9545 RepID=UPI0039B918DB